MKFLAFVLLISAATILAQTPVEHIQAQLSTAVKLKKAKVGDKLKARTVASVTLANGTTIPTGSTVLGQVLQLDAGSVTVSFDSANVDGHKIPLNITLVAIAMIGASAANTTTTMNSATPDNSHATLVPAHAGSVVGMPGVTLAVDDAPPFASKFAITNKDMQIPDGVQLMFSVR